jgi:CTP synthase
LKIKGAHTVEIDPKAKDPIVNIMPSQKENVEKSKYGGTMRLGAYPAYLKRGTIARRAYGKEIVEERHRHRYEINPDYVEKITKGGMVFSGVSPDKILMEIVELPKHPFFVGVQFHPEFQARPLSPHPLFTEFLKAASKKKK